MNAMLRATPALAAMLLVALAGGTACSQDSTPGASPRSGDSGFFKPQPDGDTSIHAQTTSATTRGPMSSAAPASEPQASVDPAQAAQIALERQRLLDEEADRVEAENRQAREQSARGTTTINGAFTGLTDERNR